MARYKKRSDGRYQSNIFIGIDPETGKREFKTVYARSIPDLENKRAEIKDLVNKGIYADDKGMTVAKWADKWFKIDKATCGIRTKEMYESMVYRYIIPDIGDVGLMDLRRSDVQLLINKHYKYYRTCEIIRMTIRQMLDGAMEDGLIYRNVANNIKLPPRPKSESRPLSETEKRAIPKSKFTDRGKVFVYILLYTGLRRGEILALSRNDINIRRNELNVRNAVTFDGNNPVFKDYPKSNAGIRVIPIPKDLQDVLYPYLNALQSIYLFEMIRKSGLMTKSSYRKFWDGIRDKINLAAGGTKDINVVHGLTAHVFRHNYCTMLYYSDVDVKDAQRLMGHSNIKITLDLYTHLDKLKSDSSQKLMNISAF